MNLKYALKIGREFRPRERHTHRLRKILEEYPDGSQVLREILQNSDDAQSTEQIFILDHNTYPSDKLFEPDLDRYQGPALLAKNNRIFEERDFDSLQQLADSEKRDQFDKIGVMGVGFNSIYHITDSPSFITGDQYVILDPHEWYFNGGVQLEFVENRLAERYPDQFSPFGVPCDEPFKGTIFRYPLRTDKGSTDSDISKKIYEPEEILEMFQNFYENESINCLLFLKYIECISFYELKEGATEPELLYTIQLENADQVREHRRLIAENIVTMMDSLKSKRLERNNQLLASYVALFSQQQKEDPKETSSWLILNYLDDLIEVEAHFQEKFGKNIRDHKFVPNVGLAIPLNDLSATGRLFCFLPLPISMPFLVSVHGYFAVSTNRRSLWSSADNEYLASDGLARLKIEWNKYLFEKVLPKAWVIFLRELPSKVPNIQPNDIHKFWPIVKSTSGSISSFCKDLLQNVIENLSIEDCVFKGPSSSNTNERWLSLSNGYLDDKLLDIDLLKIIINIGFSVISVSFDIIRALKTSRHKDSLNLLSPASIRTHLKSNRTGWEDTILREEVLQLFKYILTDKKFDELISFKMIPLANGTLGTLSQSSKSYVYIDDITKDGQIERNILKNQLNTDKLIDRSIDLELHACLYQNAKVGWNGCNLNIKVIDEIGVVDLILIIKNMVNGNENRVLSAVEIGNVIQILEHIVKIQKDAKREGTDPEKLDGLLVPSNKNILVDLCEIHYDDMEDRLSDKEKSNYIITHYYIKLDIAEGLEMQTLSGKMCAGDLDYEQNESLTSRIKGIIKDYPSNQLFKEFLQNADDAEATRFSVIVDERTNDTTSNNSFLSKEMEDWQGPAVWIYNDAKFSDSDFDALTKLGVGGKDDTKIGKFGIGFNCAFHLTDLPSLVSGKYIVFLDPNAKYLPAQGYPPRRRRGTKFNFIEKEFKKNFPNQCYPYKTIFDFIKNNFSEATEGCDFSNEFNGTLFRLPLRTQKAAGQSEISDQVLKIKKILNLFNSNESNNEMLFLRNIESCSLYHMKKQTSTPQLIWQTQIKMSATCRSIRKSVIHNPRVYQMDIEIIDSLDKTKTSEIWLLCTGGHDGIKPDFKGFSKDRIKPDFKSKAKEIQKLENFSKEKRLKPRGGVASLLARSDEESLDKLKAKSFPDPPELSGKIYSYLSLPINTNLGVHLNGNFSLPSARSGIQQSEIFLKSACDDAKWNLYILYYVLPDLHIKLLEHIVELEKERHERKETKFIPYITNSLWPIKDNSTINLYKDYGLIVIKKLGLNGHKIFWSEANNGRFVSLKDAKIFKIEEAIIADTLASLGISAVKLGEDKIEQLNKIVDPNFPYRPISGKLVCKELQMRRSSIASFNIHNSLFKLLDYILRDKSSFNDLIGLPLVPLSNDSIGKFGEQIYYIGKQEHLDLFPNSTSRFVFVDLPENLLKIFVDGDFSESTKIKKFDASAILDLLKDELPIIDELDWNPNGKSIPNNNWLENIWSILNIAGKNIDFNTLSKYLLLPIIQPSNMLVRLDMENPPLYDNGHALIPILVKLKVRFSNIRFPDNSHENLKKCVMKCTPINIINSLKRTCRSLYLTMEQLFESDLSPSDYEEFRNFIKRNFETLIEQGRKQESFMNILRSLPIWPVHYCEDKFINATSGKLLPYKLPFFSFQNDIDFYRCSDESDFIVLTVLGVIPISELEHVKSNIIPHLKNFQTPSQEYIFFLQSILSSKNREIEKYLAKSRSIPNKSLTAFVRADTLYDITVPLFCNVFEDTDNFLPPILYSNPVWMQALRRIGLKHIVNCKTIIECAREIESQFQQSDSLSTDVVNARAKYLLDYLYSHISSLKLSDEQWKQFTRIKFIPSEKCLDPFYVGAKETSGFESFAVLRFQRYKEVCWTQNPLFEKSVEPTGLFCTHYPKIGLPFIGDIIDHWFFIIEKINSNSWIPSESNSFNIKRTINEIYEIMNASSQDENPGKLIGSYINIEKKLFLNGEDPFDKKNWVAGRELVLGIQEDIKEGMYKVKECLISYKVLLLCAGATEINDDYLCELKKNAKHAPDQKEVLFKSLLDKLTKQSDNDHDVIFIVGEEKARISANRYVLSAAGLSESVRGEIEVPKDIRPDTIKVFLRWLYGQSFEDAKEFILRGSTDFNSEQDLSFLMNMLKVIKIYKINTLKDIVENIIIKDRYISVRNVHEILKCSEECDAFKLRNCCEKYIVSNKKLFTKMQ